MGKIDKTIKRASRDLFSVSLDLDLIDFKLNNIIEDLQEDDFFIFEKEIKSAKDLKERARALRKLCESVRVGWDNAKN